MTESFITLSTESTTDSNASDSLDDSTPLSTPPSTTHDTSRASFHVKDLDNFAKDLQNAADRAFPNEGRAQMRYKDVSVLLLRWEDDEMGVDWELHDLKSVFMKYGFSTERWLIPTKNSHLKLMSKAIEVVEQHSDLDSLVIVYYAGHALINNARQATWTCKSDARYASLEWSAIQTLFEKANFDVLLLLDCCAAASAAPTVGCAVTETIAACGFENSAPQPGRHSFTNTLIEVLEDWIDSPPFSAAMLHNKVLSVLKHERPERPQNGKKRKIECRRTPIHIMGTADLRLPSVELGRRLPWPAQPLGGASFPESMEHTTFSGDQSQTPSSKHPGHQVDDLLDTDSEDFNVPRVIISLALEEDQYLNSKTCEKWLSSCPALIKFAKVEAVYKSFSTLLLLSIPVFIWNMLPENPACSFVGYVTSTNLMNAIITSRGEQQALASVVDCLKIGRGMESSPSRPTQNCIQCRRSKVKCDGSEPCCGSCERLGETCSDRLPEGMNKVKEGILKNLEQKIEEYLSVAGLTGVLEEVQEVQEVQKKELKQMAESDKEQQLDTQASEAAASERSLQGELDRLAPFEKAVKEKNLMIGKLWHEAIILNDHLTKALRFLQKAKPEDNVDRQIITNHFLHFLSLGRSDPKKFEILQSIAALLNWTDDQTEQAGLARPETSFVLSEDSHKGPITVPSDQHAKNSTFPAEHDWDIIIDTCFSGPEVPSEPQDWIFNFDSPVPRPNSHERHLNINPRRHESASDETDETTFYGTIGLDDFAPWGMDAMAGQLPESGKKISDDQQHLHFESDSYGSASAVPESHKRMNGPVAGGISASDMFKVTSNQGEEVETADSELPDEEHIMDSRATTNSLYPFPSLTNPRKIRITEKLAQQGYPNRDWGEIADNADDDERRRIQNRIAQRKYRDRLRRRLNAVTEDMDIGEKLAGIPQSSLKQSGQGMARPQKYATTSPPEGLSAPTRAVTKGDDGSGALGSSAYPELSVRDKC